MLRRKSSRFTFVFIILLLVGAFFLEQSGQQSQQKAELHVSLAPEILFEIGTFPITNTQLWQFLLSGALIGSALYIAYTKKLVPGKFQNFIELVIESGYEMVKSMMSGDEKRAKRTFPLVFTMFLFILLANLFTFLPGSAALTSGDVPIFRAVTSDYGLVFVLTIIALVVVQVVAIITNGPFGYLKQFIDFSNPLNFFLGLLNLVGELAKILSLSFRLFGNMFAAEVLGAVMLFLAPYFIPLPFLFLGLITAIIQAIVFALLTTIFIAMASEIPDGQERQSRASK
jgi:F-type H+-transporting ATPase subunit a